MFKIVLCDDDSSFLNFFETLLKSKFSLHNLEILIEKFVSGKDLIENIEKDKKTYDIIFLDIDMPELNGLLIADKLRQLDKNFILLFTTNMENAAIQGYHYNTFRFILKENLESSIDEAIRSIVSKFLSNNDNDIVELKYKHRDSLDLISIRQRDIIYFSTKERRIFLKTISGDYELLVYPLKDYEAILGNSENFIIVNRSYLVNFDHVLDIVGENLLLTDNISIPMGYSKTSRAAVRKKYMLYIKEKI